MSMSGKYQRVSSCLTECPNCRVQDISTEIQPVRTFTAPTKLKSPSASSQKLPVSFSLTSSFQLYLAKSTSYEATHYVVFSNVLSLRLSSVQIFSSAPCSQTPSVCIPPLMPEIKFRPTQNHRHNYWFVYSDFYVYRQQTRRQNVLN
jgi:hypothetical protein